MKKVILSTVTVTLSLFSLSVLAANPLPASKPVIKKIQHTANEEDRAEVLKEFPQYRYPEATITQPEIEIVDSKMIEHTPSGAEQVTPGASVDVEIKSDHHSHPMNQNKM